MKIYKQEKPYWWDDNSGYGSHIQPLQFIFEHISSKRALEIGMGHYSTPFLFDNADHITSVETQSEEWYDKMKAEYGSVEKWSALLRVDAWVIDKKILDDDFDFVLSDGASFTRPFVIQHFMDKGVETLVGHDTESSWYGWHHVKVGEGYYKHQFTDIAPYTTVWTKNDNLIKALKALEAPKDKVVFFMQSFGLGDIIFCQSLANDFIKQGYKVLWGIEPQFANIQKHFPNITFINKGLVNVNYNAREVHEVGNMIVYPLRFSDSICEVKYKDCMKSKYMMFGKSFKQWKNIEIIRDTEKEKELYYNILGLKDDEEYSLISMAYRSDFSRKIDLTNIADSLSKTVELCEKNGFTLIDWSMVIERATHIHTVSSAIFYLLELLDLKCEEPNLYCRKPEEANFDNIEYLFTKKYNLHL